MRLITSPLLPIFLIAHCFNIQISQLYESNRITKILYAIFSIDIVFGLDAVSKRSEFPKFVKIF